MQALLQRYVEARLNQHHATVERVCEMALQSGELGVIVVDDGTLTLAKPSRLVPYGHMATFPSHDAFKRWLENGCPH
jgi:hypothetical protein